MKIILIDNYDSFTFNLYHYLSSLKTKVDVDIRNNPHQAFLEKSTELLLSKGKKGIIEIIRIAE